MKIFHSMVPHTLVSEFTGPRLLNFAGDSTEKDKAFQGGDSDEPDPTTPAGKKWAKLREEKKAAEEALQLEREERIKAQAKAEAFEEFKNSVGLDSLNRNKPKKQEDTTDDDVQVNPEDEKYVGKILNRQLKALGLDQIPEVVQALQQNTQNIQATTAVERAKQELSQEFAGSVPFDYEKALAFAKQKGYGLVASTVKDALRMAHKEMNEEAFIEHYRGGKTEPKKKVPSMAHSGRNDDDIIDLDDEEKPTVDIETFHDARGLARKAWAGEEL